MCIDKYYLYDVAYTSTRGFMTPYHNMRYWLANYRWRCALTKEEKFNHAHAQLINVIERAYGVSADRSSQLQGILLFLLLFLHSFPSNALFFLLFLPSFPSNLNIKSRNCYASRFLFVQSKSLFDVMLDFDVIFSIMMLYARF